MNEPKPLPPLVLPFALGEVVADEIHARLLAAKQEVARLQGILVALGQLPPVPEGAIEK